MKKQFLRRDTKRFSKLGKNQTKKQKWSKPKGRDNKIREKRKGYPKKVEVGYKGEKDKRQKIKGKVVVRVIRVNDLKSVGKGSIGVVGNIGTKKKIAIAQAAHDKGIRLSNLNVKTFVERHKMKGKKETQK